MNPCDVDEWHRRIDHELGGPGTGAVTYPGRAGEQPVLQRSEVQPAGPPHHQLPVEHHSSLTEEAEGPGDIEEGVGERPLLTRLQHHPIPAAERCHPRT